MPRNSHDDYDSTAHDHDPMQHDRQARRKSKFNPNHQTKKSEQAVLKEIAAVEGLEGGFKTTYKPGPFEEGWLLDSLRGFYDLGFISDVMSRVKGGKEANVYLCQSNPVHGDLPLAAKVYRPRFFRNLRNDAFYREGRAVLDETGHAVKASDQRTLRAIGKKSSFGEQVSHTSWLMHEYTTLTKLYEVGASVPKPYATTENAILMSYYGNGVRGASTLSETNLGADEALPLFEEAMRNIELMLQNGFIHGDLSAYNILYHEGKIVLIDFPQVVETSTNYSAAFILERDVTRVCEYFTIQGVDCNAREIVQRMTKEYLKLDMEKLKADQSRSEYQEEEEDPDDWY